MSGSSKSSLVLRWLLLFTFSLPRCVSAATLKSETVEAWNSYIKIAKSRIQTSADKDESGNRVSPGKPVVYPVAHTPETVPGGLIHDWMGRLFVADTTVSAVILMMRDYRHYHDFFRPGVITASPLDCNGLQDHFTVVFTGKSLGADSALEGEYTSTYVPVDGTHWYSVSETTHMREIEHFGAADQRVLPEGEGRGFIWKLFTSTSFAERDGGVSINVEAIALSRDVPSSLRWIAMPIVRRVSKSSLVTTLQQTSEAVSSRGGNRTVAGGQQSGPSAESRPKTPVHSYR